MKRVKTSKKLVLAYAAAFAMGGFATKAQAQTQIIYDDPLTEYPSNTELNGQLVPTGTGAGTAWSANDTSSGYFANGFYEHGGFPIDPSGSTSGVRDDATQGDAAFLPFTPEAGNVYTLTATVTGLNYMFGFSTNQSTSTTSALINTNPGLSIWNDGGIMETVVDQTINTAAPNPGVFFPQANLTLVLDTTGPVWTVALSNTDSAYPTSEFSTGPMALATNPTGLSSVGIVQSGGEPFNVTNFELTEQSVPEPATWAEMGLGVLALGALQRRRTVQGPSI